MIPPTGLVPKHPDFIGAVIRGAWNAWCRGYCGRGGTYCWSAGFLSPLPTWSTYIHLYLTIITWVIFFHARPSELPAINGTWIWENELSSLLSREYILTPQKYKATEQFCDSSELLFWAARVLLLVYKLYSLNPTASSRQGTLTVRIMDPWKTTLGIRLV